MTATLKNLPFDLKAGKYCKSLISASFDECRAWCLLGYQLVHYNSNQTLHYFACGALRSKSLPCRLLAFPFLQCANNVCPSLNFWILRFLKRQTFCLGSKTQCNWMVLLIYHVTLASTEHTWPWVLFFEIWCPKHNITGWPGIPR